MKKTILIIFVLLFTSSSTVAQQSLNVLQVGSCNIPAYKIAQTDDLLYTIGLGILGVLDVSDPLNPQEISRMGILPGTEDIAVFDTFVYLADMDSGVVIIDVSDPENPVHVGRVAEGLSVWGLDLQDEILYVAANDAGLQTFSLVNPVNPEFLGVIDPQPCALHVYVHGNLAFVPTLFDGIRIIDVSDPRNMRIAGQYYDDIGSFSVTFYNEIAYVAALDLFEETGIVYALDFSDLDNLEELGRLRTPEGSVYIMSRDDSAYVVCENSGLRVLDVSSHFQMEEVGFYDTPGMAEHVALGNDGAIFVADMDELGVYRFVQPETVNDEYGDLPSSFSLSAAYPNPFNAVTKLTYTMPMPGWVSLSAFNMSGQEVKKLFCGEQPAGIHSISWNAEGVPSGSYFIRLSSNLGDREAKVLLLK